MRRSLHQAPHAPSVHHKIALRVLFVQRLVSVACNLVPRVNALRCLVWLEATRDIDAGEELAFSYGNTYKWDAPPSS